MHHHHLASTAFLSWVLYHVFLAFLFGWFQNLFPYLCFPLFLFKFLFPVAALFVYFANALTQVLSLFPCFTHLIIWLLCGSFTLFESGILKSFSDTWAILCLSFQMLGSHELIEAYWLAFSFVCFVDVFCTSFGMFVSSSFVLFLILCESSWCIVFAWVMFPLLFRTKTIYSNQELFDNFNVNEQ